METVLVQLPDQVHIPARAAPTGGAGPRSGRPALLRLGPGDRATFGRGAPGTPVDITLQAAGVSRVAGEITAAEDYWRLSNFSRGATCVVENMEGAGEHIKVAPGRLGAPVPFEFSRVVLPLEDGYADFTVFAPQHAYLDDGEEADGNALPGEPTTSPFALDHTAKYFLVLIALCEQRLRRPSSVGIPTVPEVVERLRPLASCRSLTRAAVNYHIDYLATAKLRLRERTGASEDGRMEWKREAIVSVALRFDLVREEHLGLLPRRRASSV